MSGNQAESTRVGIIGVGGIGSAYIDAMEDSTVVDCVAVCDAVVERARSAGSASGSTAFESVGDLLESGMCDMVIVATPPSMHVEHAVAALSAGVDVLCEKPFALEMRGALEMFDAAQRHGRLLAMASKFRYVDDLAIARDLIESGVIGDPITVDVLFASHVDMADRWNSVPALSGGGVLIDNGTHAVDIVRYLVGPIRRVSAMKGVSGSPLDVEDTGVLLAETQDHAIATITVSWSVAPHNPSYVTVQGTKGTIDIGWAGSRYRINGDDWLTFGTGYAKLAALQANVENVAAAGIGRERMRILAGDAFASVAVIKAAYDAIASSAWVEVPDTPKSVSDVYIDLRDRRVAKKAG